MIEVVSKELRELADQVIKTIPDEKSVDVKRWADQLAKDVSQEKD